MITFTKQVIFMDRSGTILKTFEVGDTTAITGRDDTRGYYIISWGGVWFSEADGERQ